MKTILIGLMTDLAIALILELARNTEITLNPLTLTTRLFQLEIGLSDAGIDLAWYQEQPS